MEKSIVPSREIMKMIEVTAIKYLENYDPDTYKTNKTTDIINPNLAIVTNLNIVKVDSDKIEEGGVKYTKNKKRKKSKKTRRKKSKR